MGTGTTEGCTYLGKSFSRATMQCPVRFWTCPFLDVFYDSLWETRQNLQNFGDFAFPPPLFFLQVNLFICLLVGFFCLHSASYCPFQTAWQNTTSWLCQQANYWMVKCCFLKQYGTAYHQEMYHGQRHWEKNHHHLKSMLALDITLRLRVLIVLNQDFVT